MGSVPFEVANHAGRLVEARLYTPRSVPEVAAFAEELRRVFMGIRGKSIICADWRPARLLAPPVADALVNLLRRGNPHLERSAILLPREQALFSLQVERVVREAANPARRTFRDPIQQRTWLAEVMTERENRRTDEFLAEEPDDEPTLHQKSSSLR